MKMDLYPENLFTEEDYSLNWLPAVFAEPQCPHCNSTNLKKIEELEPFYLANGRIEYDLIGYTCQDCQNFTEWDKTNWYYRKNYEVDKVCCDLFSAGCMTYKEEKMLKDNGYKDIRDFPERNGCKRYHKTREKIINFFYKSNNDIEYDTLISEFYGNWFIAPVFWHLVKIGEILEIEYLEEEKYKRYKYKLKE